MDFDGDGDTDVLTGSFFGEFYVFLRGDDGQFDAPEVIENKRGSTQVRILAGERRPFCYNSTAFFHDWDGDGDGDLLVGRTTRLLVPNEGTDRTPSFGDARQLQIDGEPLPRGFVQPIVADWDADGRDDLLAGSHGDNIVWYRNIADQGPPVLGPPQVLVPATGSISSPRRRHDEPLELPDEPRRVTGICVADFNGDGRPDLLLGDVFGERVEFPEPTEEQQAHMAKAKSARQTLSNVYPWRQTDPPENETRRQRIERYRKVVDEWREYRAAFAAEVAFKSDRYLRHGSVWYYERLASEENSP